MTFARATCHCLGLGFAYCVSSLFFQLRPKAPHRCFNDSPGLSQVSPLHAPMDCGFRPHDCMCRPSLANSLGNPVFTAVRCQPGRRIYQGLTLSFRLSHRNHSASCTFRLEVRHLAATWGWPTSSNFTSHSHAWVRFRCC